MASWIDINRRLQIRVLLGVGMQDVTKWVAGGISTEENIESAVVTASIPFVHTKLPWFATGSFSAGPQPCQIWARVVTATDDEWQRVFKGFTEAPENSGAILPAGTLRAVSDSALWADKTVCILGAPFAGDTEIEVLEAVAANQGLTLTVSGSVTGTVIKRPLDFSGITVVDLMKRWGPVFGWVWREADGGIELIAHADVAGPTATPLWSLVPGQYYSLTERPPNRPVTSWVITAQEPALADDGTDITTEVIDTGGTGVGVWKTVWRRDITNGVMTQEIVERWEDYVVRGVTDAASDFLKVSEVTTVWTHDTNGGGMPTGRLTSKVTTTKRYYSAASSTGVGSPPYTFQDGSFHMDTDETFQEVEKVTETYTWNTTKCSLYLGTIERKAWLAPLSETAYSDAENAWPGGENRSATEETYQVVSYESFEETFWEPGDDMNQTMATFYGVAVGNGRFRGRMQGSERHSNRMNGSEQIAWVESSDGTAHQKSVVDYPAASGNPLGLPGLFGSGIMQGTRRAPEDVPGPIPLPPMDSGVSRLYTMRPILTTVTATSPLPINVKSEFNFDAESETMAQRLAKWRLRMDHADTITIQMPGVPEMKLWDPVEFTDSVRSCSARPGWVTAIRLLLDPLNGKCDQQVTVAIDPMPAVAP